MSPQKLSLEKKKDRLLRDSYRIIDANLNRSKEGLRVCEEISRFHLKNRTMTKKLNTLRHELTAVLKTSKIDSFLLFQERDAENDVGKAFAQGAQRKSFKGIFMANAQRTKEALRVLEEFLKLFDPQASKKLQKLRFNFYTLEKETIKRFPALLDSR